MRQCTNEEKKATRGRGKKKRWVTTESLKERYIKGARCVSLWGTPRRWRDEKKECALGGQVRGKNLHTAARAIGLPGMAKGWERKHHQIVH